jgi:hypothetical protein
LCPWLAFPLLGFLVGRAARERATTNERIAAAVVAVAGFAAAGAMAARGAVVHRWGTVSLAYFLFAVAIVAAAWLLAAWLATIRGQALDGLLLRGPASLLIVPLHYGALGVWAWAAGTALLVVAVLALARFAVGFLSPRLSSWTPAMQCAALGLAAAAALGAFWSAVPLLRLEVACAAEIVVAVVLLLSSRGPSRAILSPR